MATLEQIQAKLQKLQAQADALAAKNSSAVVEKIRELMAQHGLSTADIEAYTGKAKGGAKRGGKSAVAAAKKPAASATGKLPPKYRNPKTGETWSGHARPPAWIKNVKDRSKFLIDSGAAIAADAAVASKTKQATIKATPVAKKASTKMVKATTARAVKKVATKKSVSAKRAAPQSTTSKKSAGKRAAPTVKRTAVKKASATQAVVANDTVAKADVAAAPESLAARATA
ncbi:H-NS family nucleoid-associated regulatory protein [Trinickia sp. YCB016]